MAISDLYTSIVVVFIVVYYYYLTVLLLLNVFVRQVCKQEFSITPSKSPIIRYMKHTIQFSFLCFCVFTGPMPRSIIL